MLEPDVDISRKISIKRKLKDSDSLFTVLLNSHLLSVYGISNPRIIVYVTVCSFFVNSCINLRNDDLGV